MANDAAGGGSLRFLLEEGIGHLRTLSALLSIADMAMLVEQLRRLALEAKAGSADTGGKGTQGRRFWSHLVIADAASDADGAVPRCGGSRPAAEAPPDLVLEERTGMGRVLVAARDFGQGEPLFEESPILMIPDCDLEKKPSAEAGPLMRELAKRWTGHSTLDLDALCAFHARCTQADLAGLDALESHSASGEFVAGKLSEEVATMAAAKGLATGPGGSQGLARFRRMRIQSRRSRASRCFSG